MTRQRRLPGQDTLPVLSSDIVWLVQFRTSAQVGLEDVEGCPINGNQECSGNRPLNYPLPMVCYGDSLISLHVAPVIVLFWDYHSSQKSINCDTV